MGRQGHGRPNGRQTHPLRDTAILTWLPGSVRLARLFGSREEDVLDPGGENPVAEFEEEALACHQVGLDGASSPGAAADGGRRRGDPHPIEPPSGDAVLAVAEAEDGVERIPGPDDHPVPEAQIRSSHTWEMLGLPDQRVQGFPSNHRAPSRLRYQFWRVSWWMKRGPRRKPGRGSSLKSRRPILDEGDRSR